MGQVCTACSSPQSLELDAALLRGEPVRAVARDFGLTEAAARRHRDNHLTNTTEEGPEMVPEAPVRLAESTPDPDVRTVAERRLEAEERERRAGRLAALEAEERDRRDREAADREREEALEAVRQRLAALRAELPGLDDAIERTIDKLAEAIDERMKVEREMYAALAEAGTPYYGTGFKPSLQQYLSIKLGEYVPGASFDALRGAPLRERDPMVNMFGASTDAARP